MQQLLKKHAVKLRFAFIGGLNTLIDFGVLFLLVNLLSMSNITSNLIAVSVAFVFSFFANRKFTFKSSSNNLLKQALLFTVVTLFGLWVIQSAIIALINPIFTGFGVDGNLSLLVSKLIATVASLTWNYLLYSRLVFKNPSEK